MLITLQPRIATIYGENDCQMRIIAKPSVENPTLTIQIQDEDNSVFLALDHNDALALQQRLDTFLHTGKRPYERNRQVEPWVSTPSFDSFLQVSYDNMGEPYREGFRFEIRCKGEDRVYAFFDDSALLELENQLKRITWTAT